MSDILGKDFRAHSCRHIYSSIYNVMVTLLGNVDLRQYRQTVKQSSSYKDIQDLINDILGLFGAGPFDKHFEQLYLLE